MTRDRPLHHALPRNVSTWRQAGSGQVRSLLSLLVLSAGFVTPAAHASVFEIESEPEITALQPVTLHEGVNILPHFLPDGGDVTVFQSWRDNGNEHGYTDWLIAENRPGGQPHTSRTIAIRENTGPVPRDVIYDDPFDKHHAIKAVRFATAQVDGNPASLLLVASRDLDEKAALTTPVPVTISIYQLVATGEQLGHTPYEFDLISTTLSTRPYCNAMLAMSHILSLSLPADYQGDRSDGCR